MILYLQSALSGSSRMTIVDDGATDTGFVLLAETSFGSPIWEHSYSAARGTQGARPSQGKLANREIRLAIRIAGATKDALAAKLSDLADMVDDLRRYGGTCRWKSKSQTRYQSADVITASMELPNWDNRLEQRLRAVVGVRLICGPHMLGDPMDVSETFDADNVNGGDASFTADVGSLSSDLAVSNGRLVGAGTLTTERTIIHTGTGYTYGDHEASLQFAPGATITSFGAGVILKRLDATNRLYVYIDDNGANSRLRIDKTVAGVSTNLATTNLGARVVNGRRAWVRGRIEGNVIYAEHFLDTDVPNPTGTPTTSTSYTLTTAEAAIFGASVEGKAGLYFVPQSSGAYVDSFEILPFTYRNPPTAVIDCNGSIPGDAPALGRARMTPTSASNGGWGMLAWSPRPSAFNFLPVGDFSESTIGLGWSVGAVTGVTGAATSISLVTDTTVGYGARFGEQMGQIVNPATTNTGANHPLYRRFRKGVTYTATAWVRSNAATTNVRIRLGVSGDIASSTAAALSTTWTQHTATWTPTADVDVAYFAAEITAATASTWQIDGVSVYAGTTAPTFGKHSEGGGAEPPLAVCPADNQSTAALNLTRTSDATANGAFSMADSSVSAGGETYHAYAYVDTGLVPTDDYAQDSVKVEVWARMMISAAFTGGVYTYLSALAVSSTSTDIDSTEYGSVGHSVTIPSSGNSKWRMTRLGSFDLGTTGGSTRWKIALDVVVGAGTNVQAFAIDDLYIIPARSRFLSPTGKTGTGFPVFCSPVAGYWRTVESDLSSSIESTVASAPAGGITGSLLELPPGQVSLLAITSSLIPDSPDSTVNSEVQASPSIHLGITPRWHWLRDA